MARKLAESTAPTRPHPGVESATANLLAGPFAAMLDRAGTPSPARADRTALCHPHRICHPGRIAWCVVNFPLPEPQSEAAHSLSRVKPTVRILVALSGGYADACGALVA